MNRVYISKKSNRILQDYLREKGFSLEFVESSGVVPEGLSCHPDIFLCKMGIHSNSPIFFAEKGTLGMTYPEDRLIVKDEIAKKIASGYYPDKLWAK